MGEWEDNELYVEGVDDVNEENATAAGERKREVSCMCHGNIPKVWRDNIGGKGSAIEKEALKYLGRLMDFQDSAKLSG